MAMEHVTPGVLTAEGRIHFPLPQQFKTANFETVQEYGSGVTDDHSLTTRSTKTLETHSRAHRDSREDARNGA